MPASTPSTDTTTTGETSSADSVIQLYVGYLNRAPDPSGAAYWLGQQQGGMSVDQIAQAFSAQAEATGRNAFLANPDVTDTVALKAFVDGIYTNLFNRTADAEGEAFWIGQLQSGGSTIGGAVLNIMNGAQGNDLATLANKVAVANYYGAQIVDNHVQFSIDSARAAMAAVTSDPASVTAGRSVVDAYVKTAPPATAEAAASEAAVVGISTGHELVHLV